MTMSMQRWTSIDAPDWYKVTAHSPDDRRFNVWHCATRDQANSVVDKWAASSLKLSFEIRRMREWLYIETLDHIPAAI